MGRDQVGDPGEVGPHRELNRTGYFLGPCPAGWMGSFCVTFGAAGFLRDNVIYCLPDKSCSARNTHTL